MRIIDLEARELRTGALVVALVASAALSGCGEPSPTARGDASLAVTFSLEAGQTITIEQWRVRLSGPTSRTLTLQPGETRTIDELEPGTYQVQAEGLSGGLVARYGETSATVVAGENRQANVNPLGFIPGHVSVPSEWAVGQPMEVGFGTVANAQDYHVEWADNASFSGAQSTQTTGTPVQITPTTQGTLHVRVRARSRLGTNGVPTTANPLSVVDACARVRATRSVGQSWNGTLEPGRSCRDGGRFFDFIQLSTSGSATVVNASLATQEFAPFIGSFREGGFDVQNGQIGGRSRNETPVDAQHLLPAGTYWFFATSQGTDTQSPPAGNYTLFLGGASEPQIGCLDPTFVTHSSITANDARLTTSDCTTSYDESPSVVRYWDGYTFLLFPGQSMRALVAADFEVDFTRWTQSGGFQEGHFDIPPLEVYELAASSDAQEFNTFYVLSSDHQTTGTYAVAFELTHSGAAAEAAAGPLRLPAALGSPRLGLPQRIPGPGNSADVPAVRSGEAAAVSGPRGLLSVLLEARSRDLGGALGGATDSGGEPRR